MSVVRSFAGTRSASHVHSYWIFKEADNHAINEWLNNLVGDSKLRFYGAFINWAMQQVDRARDPSTKYKNADDQEKTRLALSVLRAEYPADQRRFCQLMEVYYERCYVQGKMPRGIVPNPEQENMPAIRNGERKLMEKVWNKQERAVLWVTVGNDPAKYDKEGKERRAKEQEKRAERRALEGKTALGGWEESKRAIEEAGEEAEIERTAAALGHTEIGPKQAWEEEFVDRTKE